MPFFLTTMLRAFGLENTEYSKFDLRKPGDYFAGRGGGIGQGLAMRGALEGIARNPNASNKIFTPMIIGLALIESLVIYGLVIAFILQGKI